MSFRDRTGRDGPEPEPEPFNAPQTHCLECGGALVITGPNYRDIEGLRVGGCKPCNLKAAMVEHVLPIWRRGDIDGILEVLRLDMEEAERFRYALTSDEFDPGWTRL